MSLLFPATEIYYTPYTPDEIQQVILSSTSERISNFDFRLNAKKHYYDYESPGKWEILRGWWIFRSAVSDVQYTHSANTGHTLVTIKVTEPRAWGYVPIYWLELLGAILLVLTTLTQFQAESTAMSGRTTSNAWEFLLIIIAELVVIGFHVWHFEQGKKRLRTFLKETLKLQPTLPPRS